jgi:hypothetical protein
MKSEQRYRDLIDQAFLGTLSARGWEELRAHLSSCEACRSQYDRAVRADRRLAGGAAVSPAELARVEGAIFSRLQPERPSLLDRIRAWRPMLVGAAVVAAVMLMFVIGPREDDELRPRGITTDVRPASVRAFCLTDDRTDPLETNATCSLTSNLKLSVANRGGWRYAFTVGVQTDGSPLWYEPRPPETESPAAPSAEQGEVPFGGAVRLSVNHQPGPLRIFALFSDSPISSARVEAAIKAMRPDAEVLPLEGDDVAQRSVRIEVAK